MKEKINNIIREIGPYIIILITIVIFRTFIASPVRVEGTSMKNTLNDGDFLILNKLDHNYQRDDIIVFKFEKDKLIKRIVGLPGETIEIKDNKVYINDIEYYQYYLSVENLSTINGDYPRTYIPKGYYFVLGDNRKGSLDSRFFGYIKEDKIIGKASIRLFPFDKIGKIY